MNIYTYYHPIYEDQTDQIRLIELWKDTWAANGWNPCIIGIEHAKMNPRFDEYYEVFSQFPTINSKEYELSCFLRWVAMEYIGDGVLTDYDVMNYGFSPIVVDNIIPYAYNTRCVPCIISGKTQAFSYVLNSFMKYDYSDKDHVSDQSIIQEMQLACCHDNICLEYKEEDWYKAPLVHYPYGRTDGVGLSPRWKYVKEINELIKLKWQS